MHTALLIVQIVLAVSLVACIVLQPQGSGLGSAFGTSGESYHTRRGLEKVVFIASIVLTVLFAANAIALLVIQG